MSSLVLEYHLDHRTCTRTMVLKDRGLGHVVIDQLPEWGHYYRQDDLAVSHRAMLSAMYFYCAPRTSTKTIYMTWAQALATADFLKGTL